MTTDQSRLHLGLPVEGYKPQPAEAVEIVNQMKAIEERVLRAIDAMAANPNIDPRWLAIGRTDLQKGFMAVNRAVFQPGRIALPEDTEEER
jgi:hypothetical protein